MWPVLVGLASGIVGIFVIPFLGLPIGFLIGLYVSEALRLQDWSKAITSAWVAIKALGVGILIEFSLARSEEHTSELQSRGHLVCRLLLEKKNKKHEQPTAKTSRKQ